MTLRTLRSWQRRDPSAPPKRLGRRPHSPRARREAYRAVREEMRRQGATVGEGAVCLALHGEIPTRLVRDALSTRKRWLRRREARRRSAQRASIVPAAPGVLGSLDAAQLGRVDGVPVKAEQLVDVLSFATQGRVVGQTQSGVDVVALLERIATHPPGLPLALMLDRGPENQNAEVRRCAARHQLALIFSAPHTPQHNAVVERKWKDVRGVSGLRASTPLRSLAEADARLAVALEQLDCKRRRAKHGGATAAQRDQQGRVSYTRAQRSTLWRAVCAAQAKAREGCVRARDRPRCEREAALDVLEAYGLIRRHRGGVRVRSA